MKVGYASAVELGLVSLKAIYNIGYKIDLLITLNSIKLSKKSGLVDFGIIKKKYKIESIQCININDKNVIRKIKKKENYTSVRNWLVATIRF